jgi:transcriptional regulator with XRE-family HTH domain
MKKPILKTFGANVQKARKQKGWSQEDLAKKCRLHRTYIGGIERGERNTSLINLNKIATALDVKIDGLIR